MHERRQQSTDNKRPADALGLKKRGCLAQSNPRRPRFQAALSSATSFSLKRKSSSLCNNRLSIRDTGVCTKSSTALNDWVCCIIMSNRFRKKKINLNGNKIKAFSPQSQALSLSPFQLSRGQKAQTLCIYNQIARICELAMLLAAGCLPWREIACPAQ